MVVSIPLSVLTSRSSWGLRARQAGLFLTPEEISPPPQLAALRARLETLEKAGETAMHSHDSALAEAIIDPYVNAIHVSLLREKALNPEFKETLAQMGVGKLEVRVLGEMLLEKGPETLKPGDRLLVLSDAEIHVLFASPSLAPVKRDAGSMVAAGHPPVRPLNCEEPLFLRRHVHPGERWDDRLLLVNRVLGRRVPYLRPLVSPVRIRLEVEVVPRLEVVEVGLARCGGNRQGSGCRGRRCRACGRWRWRHVAGCIAVRVGARRRNAHHSPAHIPPAHSTASHAPSSPTHAAPASHTASAPASHAPAPAAAATSLNIGLKQAGHRRQREDSDRERGKFHTGTLFPSLITCQVQK